VAGGSIGFEGGSPFKLPLIKGGQNTKGESKRGKASLTQPNPLPLNKGKGIKGIGL